MRELIDQLHTDIEAAIHKHAELQAITHAEHNQILNKYFGEPQFGSQHVMTPMLRFALYGKDMPYDPTSAYRALQAELDTLKIFQSSHPTLTIKTQSSPDPICFEDYRSIKARAEYLKKSATSRYMRHIEDWGRHEEYVRVLAFLTQIEREIGELAFQKLSIDKLHFQCTPLMEKYPTITDNFIGDAIKTFKFIFKKEMQGRASLPLS